MKTEKQEEKKLKNAGTTLVEMIVTFALIGIFMASVASVLSSAIVLHSELTATMYAQSVNETLLDKITGELAGAQDNGASKAILIGNTDKVGATVGNGISFCTKEGKSAYFYVKDGLLVMHYRPYAKLMDSGEMLADEEQEWMFDDKSYMGYRITFLEFKQLARSNVIEVTIEITNLKTGFSFMTSKCVQCYNFTKEGANTKIGEGTILKNI